MLSGLGGSGCQGGERISSDDEKLMLRLSWHVKWGDSNLVCKNEFTSYWIPRFLYHLTVPIPLTSPRIPTSTAQLPKAAALPVCNQIVRNLWRRFQFQGIQFMGQCLVFYSPGRASGVRNAWIFHADSCLVFLLVTRWSRAPLELVVPLLELDHVTGKAKFEQYLVSSVSETWFAHLPFEIPGRSMPIWCSMAAFELLVSSRISGARARFGNLGLSVCLSLARLCPCIRPENIKLMLVRLQRVLMALALPGHNALSAM